MPMMLGGSEGGTPCKSGAENPESFAAILDERHVMARDRSYLNFAPTDASRVEMCAARVHAPRTHACTDRQTFYM
jgi:hypothetical protein